MPLRCIAPKTRFAMLVKRANVDAVGGRVSLSATKKGRREDGQV